MLLLCYINWLKFCYCCATIIQLLCYINWGVVAKVWWVVWGWLGSRGFFKRVLKFLAKLSHTFNHTTKLARFTRSPTQAHQIQPQTQLHHHTIVTRKKGYSRSHSQDPDTTCVKPCALTIAGWSGLKSHLVAPLKRPLWQ